MKSESLLLPLIAHPLGQVAMLISGAALVWWQLTQLRRAMKKLDGGPNGEQLAFARGMLAQRGKILVAGLMLSALGACLLLASSQLITRQTALNLLAIIIFSIIIPGLVYINWRTPRWLLRWLLR
jgi:hypothetical protein